MDKAALLAVADGPGAPREFRMKTWNIYCIERRKGGMVVKFVGEIESEARKLRRAAAEVSKKAGVMLHYRKASTDTWRRR